jgi:hypothetical protein
MPGAGVAAPIAGSIPGPTVGRPAEVSQAPVAGSWEVTLVFESNAEQVLENYLRENWGSVQDQVEAIVRQRVEAAGGTLSHLSGTDPEDLVARGIGPERTPRPRRARRRRRRR